MLKQAMRNSIGFEIGDRVSFAQDASDTGTVAAISVSRRNPAWSDDAEFLAHAVAWYFVQWDETARPGEPDPAVWWQLSDLRPLS